MIGRRNFSAPQWRDMQTSIIGTIRYMSLSSSGFFGNIKEEHVANKELKKYSEKLNSSFINELINFDGYKSPFEEHITDGTEGLEAPLLRKITNSVYVINQQDPESAVIFKNLILHLAYTVADAENEITPIENTNYAKIANALEAKPIPENTDWNPSDPFQP